MVINFMYLLASYRLSLLLAGCSFNFFTIMSSQEQIPVLRSLEAERSLLFTLALPVSQRESVNYDVYEFFGWTAGRESK